MCIYTLSHTLEFRTSSPYRGELRCCHVSRGSGPRLLTELSSGIITCSSAPDLASLPRWALALPRVIWLRALSPREEISSAATYLMAPSGLWTTGIKKSLAAPGMQLDSHVSKARLQFGSIVQRRPS
jgi:hypothetical protein